MEDFSLEEIVYTTPSESLLEDVLETIDRSHYRTVAAVQLEHQDAKEALIKLDGEQIIMYDGAVIVRQCQLFDLQKELKKSHDKTTSFIEALDHWRMMQRSRAIQALAAEELSLSLT